MSYVTNFKLACLITNGKVRSERLSEDTTYIFPQVRMHENITVRTVPTKVKATEHAPWFERALKAMEMPSIELAAIDR